MDFPILSQEQLLSLEPEFISFLVVHGIDDTLWKKINTDNPDKAQELVRLFSKLVWEKVCDNTKVLKRISEKEMIFVHLEADKGLMVYAQWKNDHWDIHTGSKLWQKDRRQEILQFFQQGFVRASLQELETMRQNISNVPNVSNP